MYIISVFVVIATIVLLIKRYETRLVLFFSGVLLTFIGGAPMDSMRAFSNAMLQHKLFESIIAVMGFAMVMKATECDKHLVNLLVKPLRKVGGLLIPAAVLITYFINISITSSAGCSAAVGAIIIPLLMAAGIHPAIAGAAVYAGTYGAMFNPGYPQVALISSVSNTNPVDVVANHFWPMIITGLCGVFGLWITAKVRHEDKGYVLEGTAEGLDNMFHVNILQALVPILPVVILILGNMGIVPALKPIGISHAMIIGCVAAFLVTRKDPQELSRDFWQGAGNAFGKVFGIIICTLAFVGGLNTVGLIDELIKLMATNPLIAKVSAGLGPFVLGIVCGSGDAASVAFNEAITIHAAEFGVNPVSMGSVVAIAGALGRSMSPVAGGMVVCATLASTSPMETAKRNALGMIVGAILLTTVMLFL